MQSKSKSNDQPGPLIGKTLIRGILTLLPLVIILFLFKLAFDFLFDILEPISRMIDPGTDEPHWIVHILSALILFFIILSLGMTMRTRSGKRIVRRLEKSVLHRIPLYAQISELIYQFAGMKELPFSKVVLIDIYDSGIQLTGFVAEEIEGKYLTVFVPTAPNPMNGNIYHVPVSRAVLVDIPPQIAMQTIVGMGTGSGKLFKNLTKKLTYDEKPERDHTVGEVS